MLPLHIVMYIMDGERFTDPSPRFKENSKADDQLICSAIGQIDSLGRFTSLLSPGLAYPPRPGDQQSRGPAPIVTRKPGTLTNCTVSEPALTANHAPSPKIFAPVFMSLRRLARTFPQPAALL
jgi:hypothetical protein